MTIEEAVRDSIMANLGMTDKHLTQAQRMQLRNASADACRLVTQHLARENDPLLDLTDKLCDALGVDLLWVRQPGKRGSVSKYRAAIQWVLRNGVVLPDRPTLNEIGAVTAFTVPFSDDKHSTVLSGVKRTKTDVEIQALVTRLLDYCDANGIKTHPRPDWAKRKEVA